MRRNTDALRLGFLPPRVTDFGLQTAQGFSSHVFGRTEHFLIGHALKPDFPHGFPAGARVHHFTYRCNAGLQHLKCAEPRGSLQRLTVESAVLDANKFGDPVSERKVFQKAMKDGELQVGMGVDETWDDGASGIAHAIGTVNVGAWADLGDASVSHGDGAIADGRGGCGTDPIGFVDGHEAQAQGEQRVFVCDGPTTPSAP
jgi:hypothetical protein